MGYFSNGTEGIMYQARYCDQCVHDRNDDCPILLLHLMWNYEQNENKDKQLVLDAFIPRSSDGLRNEECKMFRPKQTRRKSTQIRLELPKRER